MKKRFKKGFIGALGVIAAFSIAACGANEVPVAGATDEFVTEVAETTEEAGTEAAETEESKSNEKEDTRSQEDDEQEDFNIDFDSVSDTKSGEKMDENSEDPIVRAALDREERSYSVDDLAGNWKYEKEDSIYLALYDTGKYEIYDIKSGDVTSDGSFKVDGNTLELTEDGGDPQKITISSNVRLVDDEGDLLTPYIPESEKSTDASGDNKITRAYGRYDDDLTFSYNDEDGRWMMKSASRGCNIKYPADFYADAIDDFLYVYDGDEGYVTARDLTAAYYDYYGDDEDFVNDYSYLSLLDDFEYFYGEVTNVDNTTTKLNPTDKHFSECYANLMNDYYDIQCASTIFRSTFKDGTESLILINKFYRFGDKDEKERIKPVTAGGYRK
ncbi:hypothetical protein [Oribacterium sp. FC2011]|uniref:hypothetical protein n=1 Tax=Oribacterium sp. FC2011 TaxID=1408311 RepID=UPI0004E1EA10|nr:hypothetical protein [Oribacterium sp. FC2011]